MRRWRWLPTVLAVAACLLPVAAQSQVAAASSSNQTRVLSLYALRQGAIFHTISERIYLKALGDAFGPQLDYYSELIDVFRFSDPSYESEFEDYLVRKYRDRTIDLLIANGPAEAAVAVRLQARLAFQPPIVFHGLDGPAVPNSTGHTYRLAMKESLDLALRVHPDLRHAFVVCGASPTDRWYENEFRAQVPTPPHGVELTYLKGLSVPELTDRLTSLPPHSIVFLVSLSFDADGRQFVTAEVGERLAATSNAPIYTWNGNFKGAFGGRLLSSERVAEKTIEIALRVLRGERPEDIPVTAPTVSFDALDWRQLDRWNVSEARVPPGVELRFRQPGLFQQYRGYILSAAALMVLQAVLIGGLLIQRRNRRLAENSLRESEERFRAMADTAPVMIWRSGTNKLCDFFNKPWLEFRGRSLQEEMGDGWAEGVHSEDIARVLTLYSSAFTRREPFRMEYRLARSDGEYRWVIDTGVPRRAPDGAFLGYIGSCIDIAERRQAEEALRANEAALRQSHAEIQDLAGRLITAQEAERARIARELHDDISQQLAAISIAISGCKRHPETQDHADLLGVLSDVQRQAIGLTEDIRLLSHDPHPRVLKHVGLVDALRSHCREFGRQQSIDVVVEADDDLVFTDMVIALCLYRIVQEALRNSAKHAGGRRVHVTLRRVGEEVQLAVADDGRGFSLARVREQGGLGLRSMEERVRLVAGRFSVETAPRRGTTVTVWVSAGVAAARELAGT